jgi:hypothetical protein
MGAFSQGSSFLATLGWRPQSLWDWGERTEQGRGGASHNVRVVVVEIDWGERRKRGGASLADGLGPAMLLELYKEEVVAQLAGSAVPPGLCEFLGAVPNAEALG